MTANRPKLMILGGGRDQIPIIQQARRMGFETLVVSPGGDYAGITVGDKWIALDVRARDQILDVARRENICGVLTDQLDAAVPAAAYVAQEMKLPGIGYECALRFTNKFAMRQAAERADIPVPRYFRASGLEQARECTEELGFPCIVKPVDGAGSRGISRVDHLGELDNKFARAWGCSYCGDVILEEFIHGTEVVVNGFVVDYKVTSLVTADRCYFDLPGLCVPKRTLLPSLLRRELLERVVEMDVQLIQSFGPPFGITYSEWFVNEEDGRIWLGETAIRGAGVFISSDLIPLACGVDVGRLLIQVASGNNHVRVEKEQLWSRASGAVFFALPSGTIRSIVGLERLLSISGVHRVHLEGLEVGRKVPALEDKSGRMGPILIAGEDRAALDRTIKQIRDALIVEVETPDGVKGIIW